MAKAEIKPPVPSEPSVVLELTQDEAGALVRILGRVADQTDENIVQNMYDVLCDLRLPSAEKYSIQPHSMPGALRIERRAI